MHETPHPLRIQRKRTKGWKMPAGAIYVGRPTIFGNPFATAAEFRTLLEAIIGISGQEEFHEVDLHQFAHMNRIAKHVHELQGKLLACWCSLDCECHADILCELANRENIDNA